MKEATQADIARELGISKAAVSKLHAQGMPVHDADAARRWRLKNLDPRRLRPDPGPSPETRVRRVHELRGPALPLLAAGRLDLLVEELRAAMRAVPASHRELIELPPELWAALIGEPAMAVLDAGRVDPATLAAEPADDMAEAGSVLYMLATGEASVLP